MLLVEKPTIDGVDFKYRIFNCDGGEVEHCGNGARCFVKFVRDRGLTGAASVRVQVQQGVITLTMLENGDVVVDMGSPVFDPPRVPFDTQGLEGRTEGADTLWPLAVDGDIALDFGGIDGQSACGAGRRRCRGLSGFVGGAADRTARALSEQGERRLHADRRPRTR